MSAPNNDWLQFYDPNFPTQGLTQSIQTSATTTTAAATAPISPPMRTTTTMNSISQSSSSQHLSPEGCISKPTRRRTRASRRTPTTLLNTDTTNFRAMVQQFTGGPSAPFAPTALSASGLPNLLGFGLRSRAGVPPVNNSALTVSHPTGYNLLQQQQQPHPFQPQNQHNIYCGNITQGGGGSGGDNTFFQRLSNPTRPLHDRDDEILMDHGDGGSFFQSTS